MARKIFVPFDGSRCALCALEHALALARRIGDCSIHVAHAHEDPLIYERKRARARRADHGAPADRAALAQPGA